MYSNIVVATDGSDHAAKAVDVAAQLAKGSAARMVVVHVVEPGELSDDLRQMARSEHLSQPEAGVVVPMLAGVPDWMHEAVREVARTGEDHRILDQVGEVVLQRAAAAAREAGAGTVETVLEHGTPARRVLDVARRESADLLVVGSRGLSDLAGAVFGSVSHRLAHAAPCTCITVT